MNDNQIRLEILPNEILLETFEYIDARDLYRAFYNLNSRFNGLIQSFTKLSLTLSPFDCDQNVDNEIFCHNIYTLIVNKKAKVILGHCANVHHLILHWLPGNVLDKLEADILPYLEYLYIDSTHLSIACSKIDFYDKIFTNGFPQLKFCSLSEMDIKLTYVQWYQTPSINVLKVRCIDLFIYKEILSSCPNLHFFEFAFVESYKTPTHIELHTNIKTLVIKEVSYSTILNTHIMNMYLSCVPNLKRLNIRLNDHFISQVQFLSKSNWLASIIDLYLSKLRRVNYYLPVFFNTTTREFNENILCQLEKDFKQRQKNHYQSQLIIDRKNLRNSTGVNDSDDSDD